MDDRTGAIDGQLGRYPAPAPSHRRSAPLAPAPCLPIDLAGDIDDPLATFEAAPSERLAFLGAAGSGISTVLHLLAEQLGRRSAATGGPVPVVLDPASWEATDVPFRDWVLAELRRRYASARRWLGLTMTAARGLVDAELVFPMLDGLDRMSADNRAAALTRLGESRFPFVLACRTDNYAAAVQLVGPPTGTAAVVLTPVAAPDAVAYVAARADADSSAAAPLLRDVVKSVGGDEPAALQPLTEALRHPRTIGILIKSALGDGCRPAERLLLPDMTEAGVELRTTPSKADPALTDIARQISERRLSRVPWNLGGGPR